MRASIGGAVLAGAVVLVAVACGAPPSTHPGAPSARDALVVQAPARSTSACIPSSGYPSQVLDPGFPSSLTVCSDDGGRDAHQPVYEITNRTSNVWSVRSESVDVPLLSAAPDGAVSARVATFREAQGIDQSTLRYLPTTWVIEPGTSALVQPGATEGILEVSRQYQGSWANFVAFESIASKAGTNLTELVRNEPYRKATKSCVTFGFSAFDLQPTAPTTTQTMIDDLRATAQGTKCAADLDVADRSRQADYRAGRTTLPTIDAESFSGELSRSASTLDDLLKNAGTILKRIPNHV
jgi:hypothetical protein